MEDNPTKFVSKWQDFFLAESTRLQDMGVIKEYNNLVETLKSVHEKLGAAAHEEALVELEDEYKKARMEAAQAWQDIWNRFHLRCEEAKMPESRIQEINAPLAECDESDDAMLDAIGMMRRAKAEGKSLSSILRKRPWIFLWADLSIYSVYARYRIARIAFFLLRNLYILVVPILIFGVFYPKVFKPILDGVSSISSPWPWITCVLTLGVLLLGEYYINPEVRKLQVRLELPWLSSVALQMHKARTLTLLSRTLSRKPVGET